MIRILFLSAWLLLQSAPVAPGRTIEAAAWRCPGCSVQRADPSGSAPAKGAPRPVICGASGTGPAPSPAASASAHNKVSDHPSASGAAGRAETDLDAVLAPAASGGERAARANGSSAGAALAARGPGSGCSESASTRTDRRAGISACRYTDGEIRCVIL